MGEQPMSGAVIDSSREGQVTEANGPDILVPEGRLTPRFYEGLGNHPLWQTLMDEIKAICQADIAKQTRLADLEVDAKDLPRVETRGSEVPSVQGTQE